MISPSNRSAIARASALLPVAVGPRTATSTGARGTVSTTEDTEVMEENLREWRALSNPHQHEGDEPEQKNQEAELLAAGQAPRTAERSVLTAAIHCRRR